MWGEVSDALDRPTMSTTPCMRSPGTDYRRAERAERYAERLREENRC